MNSKYRQCGVRLESLEDRILLFANGSLASILPFAPVRDAVHERLTEFSLDFLRDEIKAQLSDANVGVDTDIVNTTLDSSWHFDSSQFEASVANINSQYQSAMSHAGPTREEFRSDKIAEAFGRLLHVVQDFYSHSNWVNHGRTDLVDDSKVAWNITVNDASMNPMFVQGDGLSRLFTATFDTSAFLASGAVHGTLAQDFSNNNVPLIGELLVEPLADHANHEWRISDEFAVYIARLEDNAMQVYQQSATSWKYELTDGLESGKIFARVNELQHVEVILTGNVDDDENLSPFESIAGDTGYDRAAVAQAFSHHGSDEHPTGGLNHDHVGDNNSEARPLFAEAYALAARQTRHEFSRLCHLIRDNPNGGSDAVHLLIDAWVKPDDESRIASYELCGITPLPSSDDFGNAGFFIEDFGRHLNESFEIEVETQADNKIVIGFASAERHESCSNEDDFHCDYDVTVIRLNADGSLDDGSENDTTPNDVFGKNGIVAVDFGSSFDTVRELLVTETGTIFVVGNTNVAGRGSHFALGRILNDGSLDTSFGNAGVIKQDLDIERDNYARAAALDRSDGSLVVVTSFKVNGEVGTALARFSSLGEFDKTFYETSSVIIGPDHFLSPNDIAIDDLRNIYVVADSGERSDRRMGLIKYREDGSPDDSFGAGGVLLDRFEVETEPLRNDHSTYVSLSIDSERRILVGGTVETQNEGTTRFLPSVARFLPSGAPDEAFGDRGKVVRDSSLTAAGTRLTNIESLPGDKVLVSGYDLVVDQDAFGFSLQRLNRDGDVDTDLRLDSFDQISLFSSDVALDQEGNYFVAGVDNGFTHRSVAIAKYQGEEGLPNASLIFRQLARAPLARSRFNEPDAFGRYHVGLRVDDVVYESHPQMGNYQDGGFVATQWVDHTEEHGFVTVQVKDGVQASHSPESFRHFTHLDDVATPDNRSVVKFKEVSIPYDLAEQMAEEIKTKFDAGFNASWDPQIQKGSNGTFSSAGLIEWAAEKVGLNGGEGFIPSREESVRVEGSERVLPGISPITLMAAAHDSDAMFGAQALHGYLDPVDFILTDPQGRRMGFTEEGGEVNEIPNAYYSGNGIEEFFVILDPLPGEYDLQLVGLSEDAYAVMGNAAIGIEFDQFLGKDETHSLQATIAPLQLGDFNGDAELSSSDVDLLFAAMDGTDDAFDLNSDTRVDREDARIWVKELKGTWFGDANLDGVFDTTDLIAVFAAGEYEDGVEGNSSWASGDWDGNGEFDSGDLIIAFSDGGFERGPLAAARPTRFEAIASALYGDEPKRRGAFVP